MSKRIGLLTLPLHTNYGGILQAVALYRVLTHDLEKEVVFLERWWRVWPTSFAHRNLIRILQRITCLPRLRNFVAGDSAKTSSPSGLRKKLLEKIDLALRAQRMKTHEPFIQRHLPRRSGKLTSTQEFANAVQSLGIDTLVVGSDQVWRLDYVPPGSEEDFFFGSAPSPAVRKLSYAASFGHSTWKFPDRTARTKDLLAQFDAISVRETSGADICTSVFGRPDAVHVIDPTLLVDPAYYEQIAGPTRPKAKKSFLSYVLDQAPDRQAYNELVQQALGSAYAHRSLTLDTGSSPLDVPGWLRAFIDADFVLTDSFHGMVFSIIFRKNFVALVNHNRGADRFTSLLNQLGLTERLIFDASRMDIQELVHTPINFLALEPRIAAFQGASMAFLRRACSPGS